MLNVLAEERSLIVFEIASTSRGALCDNDHQRYVNYACSCLSHGRFQLAEVVRNSVTAKRSQVLDLARGDLGLLRPVSSFYHQFAM